MACLLPSNKLIISLGRQEREVRLSINTDPQNKKSSDLYIPEHIRYDPNLSFFQKFLLAEIIALSKQTGQCWATNKHFAEAYNVSVRYVIRNIQDLIKSGYLKSKIDVAAGNERFLTYAKTPLGVNNSSGGVVNNSSGGGCTIVHEGSEQLFSRGVYNSSLPPTSESTDTSMRNGRNQTPNKKYNNKINNIINKQNNFFQKNVDNFERQKLETEALGKTKTYMQIMEEHFARVKAQREKRGSG